MRTNPTIIGIDGGASKVRAHIIEVDGTAFSLGKHFSTKEYKNYPDYKDNFKPVDITAQLSQLKNNSIELTAVEKIHANSYYAAFIDAITEISKLTKSDSILIGIGMPGIKSSDGRGIIAMANGPRMPEFAHEIEQRLKTANIVLATPITKLGSDADYCGIGEEYGENGAFRNIENAYYLGGGTGTADALKLHGKLISFDVCKEWIAKTWEMSDKNGKSMETYCSANGIQSVYSELVGISQSELTENNIYLEQILELASKGDEAAITTWQIVSKKLADLIFERISTIYGGWQNNFSFINQNKPQLVQNHIYRNTLLDRIVIGQRLGNVFQNPQAQKYLIEPLVNNLSELVRENESLDKYVKLHYLKNGKFYNKIIISSQLRSAPALGAGIDAYRNFKL